MPQLIRVLLVDDHRLVRAGLQSLLDATGDIRVAGTAADATDLVEGVRAAAAGQSPLDPEVARTLLTRRTTQAPQDQLSDREREVLGLVADGLANKQIARHLGISERTVKPT